MHHEHVMSVPNAQTRLHNSRPVLVNGRLRWISRAIWLIVAFVALGLFIVDLPFRYQQLLNPCLGDDCIAGQLSSEAFLAIQNLDFPIGLYAAYHTGLAVLLSLAYNCVAFFIFWRRSHERMALLVSLWLVTFGTTINGLAIGEGSFLLVSLHGIVDQLGWVLLLPLFLLTFPDGRFVPSWTRWLFTIYLVFSVAGVMIEAFLPDTVVNEVGGQIAWFGIQITGIGTQIFRYLRIADATQRQQTKWFVFGLVLAALLLAFTFFIDFSNLTLNRPGLAGLLDNIVETTIVSAAFMMIPLTLGVSILRYRLWDIDLIINRALFWGSLSGIVIGLYMLTVGALGAIFQSLGTFLPSMLATGLIALLFHPLRQRVQRGVNRLVYGERDEPYSVLSRLGRRLEATLAPESVLPSIVETVSQTLKLPYVAITLKEGSDFQIAASSGEQVEALFILSLTYHGEEIGQLLCGQRRGGEPFKGEERRLLEDIARQAGVALQAVKVNADLQRSRERLVVTREEERRRIRRDLHDGLGPALASQTLKIGSARALLKQDPEAADLLLQHLETDTMTALKDIRRLIYNLRPPALDELGLFRAIQQDAPRLQGLNISFELQRDTPELSAAVEAAVYRIVQEALANIVRHAGASTAVVCIETGSELHLIVTDNGQGLADGYHAGVGLRSMQERTEELGGIFKIVSEQGKGTTIDVRLPLRTKGV